MPPIPIGGAVTHSSTSGTRGKRGRLPPPRGPPAGTRRAGRSRTRPGSGPPLPGRRDAPPRSPILLSFSWLLAETGDDTIRVSGDYCPGTSAPSRCRCCRTVTASTQTAAGPDRGPDEPAGCRTLLLLRKRAIRCIGHCVWQPAVYQRRSGDRQSQGHQRIYAVLR